MKKHGMVGKVLIHNYPYGAYFNGADDEQLDKLCTKAWMLQFVKGRHPSPETSDSRITHVWAGAREEAAAIAGSCRIENVCDTLDEVIDNVDGVLILDEDIESRTETVERCLSAGKSVFVDKVLSLSVEKTKDLLALAASRGGHVAAWSQLLFAVEARPFRDTQGGTGLVTFNLSKEIVDKYGVHLVCSAFAAFGADPVHMAKLNTGPNGAPAIVLSYSDGKDVVLRAGQDLPPRGNVAYFGKGRDPLVAQLADMGTMFDGSAEALASMFEQGKPPLPPEAIVRMTQACGLLSE